MNDEIRMTNDEGTSKHEARMNLAATLRHSAFVIVAL